MVCLRSRSTLWADVAPGLSSSSRQRGVLGSQSAIPDDGRRHALPSHSFAVLNILECSFVNYIMSHPLLHSAISSSPVIEGFINDGPGFELPMVSLEGADDAHQTLRILSKFVYCRKPKHVDLAARHRERMRCW